MLSQKYQDEQGELDGRIVKMKEALSQEQQTAENAEKWIGLIREFTCPIELTAELLNTLIEKITIHETVKHEDGSKEQKVEIYYRFIGKIERDFCIHKFVKPGQHIRIWSCCRCWRGYSG